ncbi:glycerophosphodiester phosphodiesterase family protein [Paraconexibacter sp.]|uniref:glycerophosphodiester phosphodiesterase family protein n=1 Tax=Paraconexibacter sp. TaxID=2949640 RepID=UPI00356915B2
MTRFLLALGAVLVLAPLSVASAATNPWLEQRVLNMTHQGGENEHPSGTMYALRESLGLGADMLELDVQPTKDGTLMVLHDQSVERTTGEDRSVYDLSVEETQKLDAAFNFVPGRGTVRGLAASEYPLRGVRTGEKAPPLGYTADDFRIPTLEEVLRAFPDVPMNIEIKGRADDDTDSFLRNADLLVALLKRVPYPPLVVVSFNQDAVDRFHKAMPDIAVAPGITGVAQFMATGVAPEGTKALQVPPSFNGLTIMTPDFVARAHRAGYAVHVWFSGQEESERVYKAMLDMGADGLMPAKPRDLEKTLCARKDPRPAGNPNHCEGGTRQAAARCAPRLRTASSAGASGRVTLKLARREKDVTFACGGVVRLRGAHGASPGPRSRFGSAVFHFPYGVREVEVTAQLGPRTRGYLRRGARRLKAAGEVRVDGQSRSRARRVTLRR